MSATALYKALRYANVPEDVAEKAVESVPIAQDVATKSDIANVRADIAEGRADIAESRADTAVVRTEVAEGRTDTANVRTEVANVRKEIADVRTELKTAIAQLEVRMVKWNIALHIAFAGSIVGAMGLMIKFWIL